MQLPRFRQLPLFMQLQKLPMFMQLPVNYELRRSGSSSFSDTGKNCTGLSSSKLALPSGECWKSLEDALIAYMKHDDGKFDYINGIAERKHITVDDVRYLGKEISYLDESMILGIKGIDEEILEYVNLDDFNKRILWLLLIDLKQYNISRQALLLHSTENQKQTKIKL